ncbi:MAG TPA: hypothetical protein VHM70_07445 [Polyangiaceae bacterium]|nr:hypothetical protein [Polyangiaceae bacterium]
MLSFESVDALAAAHDRDLRRGRALVPNQRAPMELGQRGELTLNHPVNVRQFVQSATLVWISEDRSTLGLEFEAWTPERAQDLESFVVDVDDDLRAEPRRIVNIYDRVRAMNHNEQQQLARSGTHVERVALERCFSGSVWESLLHNPQLTPAEVANIAKKGSLPRPLVSFIANNAAWRAVPEVQRALLSNPRLDSGSVARVLRSMSRADLQLVLQQSCYPATVKQQARSLLG